MNNVFPASLKGLHIVPLTKNCRANICTIGDYCTDEVSTNAELCKPCNEKLVALSESGTTDGSDTDELSNSHMLQHVYKKPYTHYSTTS